MFARYFSKQNSKILVAGFAIFAMFFGSGNLVFPLMMGVQSGSHWLSAALGLACTGVLLPLLGLASTVLIGGSRDGFFSPMGKLGVHFLPFIILLLIGPLGVVPRCITVAYGAWQSISPSTSLWSFSTICVAIVWLFTSGKSEIVGTVGKYFTPIKLGALLIVIGGSLVFALTNVSDKLAPVATGSYAFNIGFFQGYHTMDLLATAFFGADLFAYLRKQNENTSSVKRASLVAIFIGMLLLLLVYISLIYLGAAFHSHLANISSTNMLPVIAEISLGSFSHYLISFTLIIACMTTAVALTSVSVGFLCEKFIFCERHRKTILSVAVIMSFIMSLRGFEHIMALLGPPLSWIYPVLVCLAVMNIIFAVSSKIQSSYFLFFQLLKSFFIEKIIQVRK